MDLRQKLARLSNAVPMPAEPVVHVAPGAPGASTTDDTRAAKIAELRTLIGGVVSREQRRAERNRVVPDDFDSAGRLPWQAVDTEHGTLHVIERDLDAEHHHGKVAVNSALQYSARTLAALTLDPSLGEIDLSRMLLLDTETTGLSGGTGTVAFLVGLARFEDGALRIEQLILPNLGNEGPMLARLAQRLREASCIVTYNGKSFDWPLLRTRFVLGRMPAPALPPHVDLLHTTRRIWKARLGSVRLTEIEREILRFEREGDIDGSEIPTRYFTFLREGGAQSLLPIIEHNQNDLIALAAMLGRLSGHLESGDAGGHAQDALAFGKLCARGKDTPRALGFAQAALDASAIDSVSCAALELTFDVERRGGDASAAARALEAALGFARDELEASRLHVALAKLYEHRLRDCVRALQHAQRSESFEGVLAHERRLGRLRRRIEREAARAGGVKP